MIPDSLYIYIYIGMAFVMKHCVADTSWSRLSDTFTVSTAAPLTQELPSLLLLSRGSNRALFSLQSPEWSNRGLNIPPKTISSWAMASILQAQIPKGLSSEKLTTPMNTSHSIIRDWRLPKKYYLFMCLKGPQSCRKSS